MSIDRRTPLLLGIECGATRTVALCADIRMQLVARVEAGPANLRLLNQAQLLRHFRTISHQVPRPAAICVGMAGARSDADFRRIRSAAAATWKGVPCHATNDLETALSTAPQSNHEARARVLILSGTGSCCFGRSADGQTAKVGGWGHILGDKGSGYEIGLRALKAVVFYFDRDGKWPRLGASLLRALQLNEPNDLIAWVQTASKADIAALARDVFRSAERRDKIARDILEGAAHSLVADGAACAARLGKKGTRVDFIFAGGVLKHQPAFRRAVERQLRRLWPASSFIRTNRESAWGAVELARRLVSTPQRVKKEHLEEPKKPELSGGPIALSSLVQSPTEQRNPRSMRLDKLSIVAAIKLMLKEDQSIPAAILREAPAIEKAVKVIVQGFRRGGRLFYVGAGTSGRLGVLDASECPPTFQTPPEMVQGIMAGGQRALWEAVEGAEDDSEAGVRAIEFRGVDSRDVVVGIAASGRTPFVWGALRAARQRGAKTVLLTFNPFLQIPSAEKPTVVIAPNVGPEILTGSTRLKAGTATKLILNIFTTVAMVRLGKVLENLMIDVKASNSKLRDRAVRIVQQLTKSDYETARAALEERGWQIRAAYRQLR